MRGNVLNHNRETFSFKLNNTDYWDFHLSLPYYGGNLNPDDCLISFIDTENPECILPNGLKSSEKFRYTECRSNGLLLENIGLTGMDNGLIKFDVDTITDEEFYELFTNSTYEIPDGDCSLKVDKVDGNNKVFRYDNEIVVEDGKPVAKLNGGFFQGFFKKDNGCVYQVLPSEFKNGITLMFELKKSDFDSSSSEDNSSSSIEDPRITLNDINPSLKGTFFYMGTRAENKWYKYYDEGVKSTVVTKNGNELGNTDLLNEIDTDNKFVLFDRTCDGFTVDNYEEGDEAIIKIGHKYDDLNFFTLMNRTPEGYTVDTIKNYKGEGVKKYDIYEDLYKNALSFQITDEGRIGYRYLVRNCEYDETISDSKKYKIESEWSYDDIVQSDEWVKIVVKLIPYGDIEPKKMRLMFFVNGKLVLLSKELDMINLRNLQETIDKQEGVAYNISLGGGSQGLCDVVYEDFKNRNYDLNLPIINEFGGTFIGYFKTFKFFDCLLNFEEINLL